MSLVSPRLKKCKIAFLDLIRALAVLLLIISMTVNALLSQSYWDLDVPWNNLWFFVTDLAFPFFFFVSGTLFLYMFRMYDEPFFKNPGLKRGLLRALLLIVLGYLIQYPADKLYNFEEVSLLQWQMFYSVGLLKLIGVSIILLIIFAFIAEKLRIGDVITFIIAALGTIAAMPFIYQSGAAGEIHPALAAYISSTGGSQYPVIPYAAYMFTGAIVGSYVARHPLVFKDNRFSFKLITAGFGIIVLGLASELASDIYGFDNMYLSPRNYAFIYILGISFILYSLMSFTALKFNTLPKLVIRFGRNSLFVYLIIYLGMYGTVWFPGLIDLYGQSFNPLYTAAASVGVILLVVIIVSVLGAMNVKYRDVVI